MVKIGNYYKSKYSEPMILSEIIIRKSGKSYILGKGINSKEIGSLKGYRKVNK